VTQPPAQGHMYLFDSVTPPLEDGSYRLTAGTRVSYPAGGQDFSQQRYFDVVGPRFAVPQAMVAATFPPANAHGSFSGGLPHIVLSRRTLPWERELDPGHLIPAPAPAVAAAEPEVAVGVPARLPWVALLVFEEGEYTLLRGIPLAQAVPAGVLARLGAPAGVTCDAVQASRGLIESILPSAEELELLCHVRWVNVDDRELNAAGGDGYYAVVVASRLPSPGAQCRAILVSLEERSDLVQASPPAVAGAEQPPVRRDGQPPARHDGDTSRPGAPEAGAAAARDIRPSPIYGLTQAPVHTFSPIVPLPVQVVASEQVRLVALTSWQFTCEGPGTFRELMQNLDVAMLGTIADPGAGPGAGSPSLADTGHLQLQLQDRLGATEPVWYRGPLVPYNLTRDPLGPYHSADQARRVAPETGSEDISYAAAFEAGRLLAAADPRFAQAIMAWRRESYKQSARASTIASIASRVPLQLPPTLAETLHTPVTPAVAAAATRAVVASGPPIADAYGLTQVQQAAGLDSANLAEAWNLASSADAEALLGGDPGTLGAVVTQPAQTVRGDTTLSAVAADTGGLDRLTAARQQAVANAKNTLGGS
jgi:hypothetical protein